MRKPTFARNRRFFRDAKKLLLENIFLVACIFLTLGLFLLVGSGWGMGASYILQLIGEALLSGGFFGIIISLIVARYEELTLREALEDLCNKLIEREIPFKKYKDREREMVWKLKGGEKDQWTIEGTEIFSMIVGENTGSRRFVRWTTVSLEEVQMPRVHIESDGVRREVVPTILEDVSTPLRKIFNIPYEFMKGKEYKGTIHYEVPECMDPDSDFIWVHTRVFSEKFIAKTIFPDTVNIGDYEISAFILDVRLMNVRDLCCTINKQENSVIIEDERELGYMRRVNEGDAILFRYRRAK